MKIKILLVLLVVVGTTWVMGQTPKQGNTRIMVKGSVYDKDDQSPVMQATVQLLSLPDSTMVTGNVTDEKGKFSLSARTGKYVLKVSFIGYLTYMKEIELNSSKTPVDVGKISLTSDAIMLSEAVVVAEAPQVTVSGDTLGYNVAAYRTPEGAMLEDLIKKIPGAEVDDDGNVKINGKEIKKVMIDGKEFFGGDVKTALQNLPVEMIEKITAYDKESDNARITGIDDGNEETVLDLKVKEEMNRGWFGNIDGGVGTEDRYSVNSNINRFAEGNDKRYQVSFIGKANNVNNMRFGGGGGPRWRRNNGLSSDKELGLNFSSETKKFEIGGSVRYHYRSMDVQNKGQVENFLPSGNSSFSNSNGVNQNTNRNVWANLRMEWRPDTLTTFFMRASMSYGKSESSSNSLSATFNSDPYAVVYDPNDFLRFDADTHVELDKIRVNASDNVSLSEGNNISSDLNLQLTRRLNDKGRNITLRGFGNYGDNENERYSSNMTRYYNEGMLVNEDTIRRYISTPSNNYNAGAELSYSEPIADKIYLQFSYRFQYGYSESDNSTYNMPFGWKVFDGLPEQFFNHQFEWLDSEQSKYAEYKRYNHDARITFRANREKWHLSAGMAFRPQKTTLSYRKGEVDTVMTRRIFNFSPEIDYRYQPQKQTQLRFTYRGRTSEPGMESLLPVTDNSNPLNIYTGNPGLKSSFSHNMEIHFNTFNIDTQRGVFSALNGSFTQNAISSIRLYNETTGGWTTMPENINGNWNMWGMFGMNTALKKNKKITIGTFTNAGYNNQVSYITTGEMKNAQKNTTTNLSLGERLNATFRNDWLEVGLNGSFNYTFEKDKLNPQNNQEPYTFSYGGNFQVQTPWKMTFSSNMVSQARRGYTDSNMNRNEVIWNAQVAQSFLKGGLTFSMEWNDILRQQSNISRSLTSMGRSVYTYNGVNSFGMIRVIYRLNVLGGKKLS